MAGGLLAIGYWPGGYWQEGYWSDTDPPEEVLYKCSQ